MNKSNNDDSWVVYIVRCDDGSLYTGITTDIERRVKEHNGGPRGANYTRARRPVTLAFTESVADRSAASKLEAWIKSCTRQTKESIINKQIDVIQVLQNRQN